MFKNQSLVMQLFWSGLACCAIFALLGMRALEGNRMTKEILQEFFHDFFGAVDSLEAIEELYEMTVRSSIQDVLKGAAQPSGVIEPIEKAMFDAGVHLKEYSEMRSSLLGEHDLLNQAFENALAQVNLSWIPLKESFQEKKPDFAKITTYVLQEFYPDLNTLSHTYLQLLRHWLNQLSSKRTMLYETLRWQSIVLPLILLSGFAAVGVLGFLLARRIRQTMQKSASQVGEMKNQKTNFTMRMQPDELETRHIAEEVNGWMDEIQPVMRRIKVGTVSLYNLLPQLAGSLKELTGKIGDFSRFSAEVGKTANDISFTSKELVKLMADVSQTATVTAKLAESGQTELVRLEETMKQMEDASRKISKRLAIISEKAANITMVVTTINKFADQTNLLSLNASIEAEKAGEYGLGFAVVAKEIRRLADQVARATYDIEQMVKEMASAVTSGVMEMDQFSDEVNNDVRDVRLIGTQFVQIIEQVQTLIPYFASVHRAVETQALGAQQISDSMVHLNDAVDKTAALLSGTSSKIHHMRAVAEKLHTETQGYIVDKG